MENLIRMNLTSAFGELKFTMQFEELYVIGSTTMNTTGKIMDMIGREINMATTTGREISMTKTGRKIMMIVFGIQLVSMETTKIGMVDDEMVMDVINVCNSNKFRF